MIQETSITLFTVQDVDRLPEKLIREKLAQKLRCSEKQINGFFLKKKSLDARHGKVKFHLRYQHYPVHVPELTADHLNFANVLLFHQ